ncbi:MAG: nitroreductase family protein [Desulfonatronovibrionaceae bacterium]
MELFDALYNRRSIRRFTGQKVDREHVARILDCGRWAPSGLNNQPWRFLVVNRDDPRKDGLQGCTKYSHVVLAADILIVVFLAKEAMYSPVKDYQGVGACIQNMLLAAHGLGLGAVWLGEILNREDRVHEVLGTNNSELGLMAVLALGHPEGEGGSNRRELSELMLED